MDGSELKALMREAAKAVLDLRFVQTNAVTCLGLTGKAYREAEGYMLKLKNLQERLEKAAI